MKLVGIVLAFALCGASAAKADWEYTTWGMTPDQVVSASKSLAKAGSDLRPDSDGNVTKLVAPFQRGQFSFEAQFGFDAADRLASVTLVLDDESAGIDVVDMVTAMQLGMNMTMKGGVCWDLDLGLNGAYGLPAYHGANDLFAIEKWPDQKNKADPINSATGDNDVDYHALYEVGCYVQYSAIKSAAAR